MATLLMPSDHHQQPRRTKKAKNGQKKQPQRGLGVAQLEKLRLQEESKKMVPVMVHPLIAPNSSVPSPFHQSRHGVSALCYHPQLQAAVGFQPRSSILKPGEGPSLHPHHHHHHHVMGGGGGHGPYVQILQQEMMISRSSSSSRNSGSCKSGLSSEKKILCSSSSPSPCSSQLETKPDLNDELGGDESSHRSPGFLCEPTSLIAKNNSNTNSNLIINKNGFNSSANTTPTSNTATTTTTINNNNNSLFFINNNKNREWLVDSEMFDPSFRTRKRVQDCRDWPGVYGVPAIKELSSFQIPGNTHPALSNANRTRSSCCDGAWASVRERDGLADAKIIGSSSASSPRACGHSAVSSWPRREVCFSFDGTLAKDSCSSSFNNSYNNYNNTNKINGSLCTNLDATTATTKRCDFLALSLSSAGAEVGNSDGESSSFKLVNQEASDETDSDWNQSVSKKALKTQYVSSPGERRNSSLKLDLSLKVPSMEESSLELKLAL